MVIYFYSYYRRFDMRYYLYEDELITILKTKYPNLVTCSNPYSRYDLYTDNSIVELKSRRSNYLSYIIEKSKYDALIELGKKLHKEVYYIVSDLNNIYIFDLNKVEIDWRFNSASTRTDFDGGVVTTRLQGFIDIRQAYVPFDYVTLKNLKQKIIKS